jgi:hypothetical protein
VIHVIAQNDGTLRITDNDGVHYCKDSSDLSPVLRERLAMLQAADVGSRIEGVGCRMGAYRYWVVEDKDAKAFLI